MRNRLNEEINRFKEIISVVNSLNEATNDGVDFVKITGQVIDKLEGGYYHPDMRYRLPGDWSKYGRSGETMFGIDRLRGGSINETPAGKEFWGIIDNVNAKNTWKWNYKGGQLGERLKVLVAQMMKPQYDSYCKSYLTPEALKIVNSSKALTFNFIYATWNGPGWFKKFATRFNEDVKSGLGAKDLTRNVINYRKESGNRIIVDTGKRLEDILPSIDNMNFTPSDAADTSIATKTTSNTNVGTTSQTEEPGFISTLYNKFLDSQKASNKA
jgi:hypothetical protein